MATDEFEILLSEIKELGQEIKELRLLREKDLDEGASGRRRIYERISDTQEEIHCNDKRITKIETKTAIWATCISFAVSFIGWFFNR